MSFLWLSGKKSQWDEFGAERPHTPESCYSESVIRCSNWRVHPRNSSLGAEVGVFQGFVQVY